MTTFIDTIKGAIKDLDERIAAETSELRKSTDWPDFKRRSGLIEGVERSIGILRQRVEASNKGESDED